MNVSRRVHRSDSLQDNRRLRAQLSAERGQLLRAAAAHVFSCGAVACCFWAQQGAAPGFPGPFWATCEITPVSRHDPWVSGYLGCISVPTPSTLSHMTPIHPSVDMTVNSVMKAVGVESKFKSGFTQSPP